MLPIPSRFIAVELTEAIRFAIGTGAAPAAVDDDDDDPPEDVGETGKPPVGKILSLS